MPWTSTYCSAQTRRRVWTAGILPQPGLLDSRVNRLEQSLPIRSNDRCERLTCSIGLGHLVVFDPMGIAVIPCWRRQGLHPGRRNHGKTVQRRAEGLPHALQPIEDADGAHHMRGVCALPAAGFEQPMRACHRQQSVQEQGLNLPSDQPGAKLAQDGMVEAGIGQFQAQDIFPINAAADRIRRLAIGETFSKLEKRGQRQAGRRFGGLAACGKRAVNCASL